MLHSKNIRFQGIHVHYKKELFTMNVVENLDVFDLLNARISTNNRKTSMKFIFKGNTQATTITADWVLDPRPEILLPLACTMAAKPPLNSRDSHLRRRDPHRVEKYSLPLPGQINPSPPWAIQMAPSHGKTSSDEMSRNLGQPLFMQAEKKLVELNPEERGRKHSRRKRAGDREETKKHTLYSNQYRWEDF